MVEAGLEQVETYLVCFKNIVAQLIATKPILDLFLAVDQSPRVQVTQRWWEHENLDLEGRQATARAADVADMGGMEEDGDEQD